MKKPITFKVKELVKNKEYYITLNLPKDEARGFYPMKRTKFLGTEREAHEYALKWIYELEHPEEKSAAILTKTWLNQWLSDNAKPSMEQNSYDRARRIVEVNIIPHIGEIALGDLAPADIRNLFTTLETRGKKVKKGNPPEGLSARTVQYVRVILNQALNEAVTLRKIKENPAKDVKPSKKDKDKNQHFKKWHVLDKDHLHDFLEAIQNHQDYSIIFTAAYTGARQSELLGLTWDKILWSKKGIRIDSALHRDEESELGYEHRPRTKNVTSTRTVVVTDGVIEVLEKHRESLNREQKKSIFVFTEPDGEPMKRDNLSHRFARLAANNKHDGMTFHDLRHTHATILLSDGAYVNEVSERLGHADPRITYGTYGHVLPGKEQSLAERFADLISGKKSEKS